jgi:hypothetical protein
MRKTIHLCDICKREFDKPEAVQNGIAIDNGEHTGYWSVCVRCIEAVSKTINELKK